MDTSVNRELLCGDPKTGKEGVVRPITWSDKDTPETVRQAKERNSEYKALCE